MKIVKYVLVGTLICITIFITYGYVRHGGFGCSHDIVWARDGKIKEGEFAHDNNYIILNSDELKISMSLLNKLGDEVISSLYIENKSNHNVSINDLNLQYYINNRILHSSKVEIIRFDACTTQPCASKLVNNITEYISPPQSVVRLNYIYNYHLNSHVENGNMKITFELSHSGKTKSISHGFKIEKYEIRYNCLSGTGHDFIKIN